MKQTQPIWVVCLASACWACSAGSSDSSSDSGSSSSSGGEGGSGGSLVGGGGEGGIGFTGGLGGSGGCDSSVDDADSDGFTIAEGDCNDCDANVNPGAIEVPTDPRDVDARPVDENCNGEIDEAIPGCDEMVPLGPGDPREAARAMDMCTDATFGGKGYGVLETLWTHADGNQAGAPQLPQFGVQSNFGPNVSTQMGTRMVLLSSGFAKLPGELGAATNNSASAQGFTAQTPPAGFPADVPGCAGGTDIYDDIGLQVRLRAPTNATGYRYSFKFYSFEFAEYVCTTFNDQYVAIVTPPPMGAINGNISFDSANNPVSVNIAFFDVCDPVANNDFAVYCGGTCPAMPSPYCPLGPAELMGNGFDNAFGSNIEDAGATGWLQTTAPVGGGEEFTIRFAIWDTGDNAYDSSVLLDGFEWIATPGTKVVTEPPAN